ncbi:MAG: Gfo/Idh/MocA family oxidoreductase [Litoreibacter sp.]|nr:Gfo/Idh/MocA family oxidoreductase [Litoreibacter sp.]
MEPVNWGILGAAKFARQHMGPAIHLAKGARLAAVASRSGDVSAFQAFAPDCKAHSSYDALLADPDIEAVYIPLPNHLHIEWAMKAMKAGKHVLCEKPIAMKADEIDALIAMRDETGLLCAEAFMILHHPQWQRAREIVQGGGIGRLRHVSAQFCYNNAADPGNIRNKPDTGGGGVPDIGVYTLGSTRFVTGAEPAEVSAKIDWENGVDVQADIAAQFDGFTLQTMVSMRMANFQQVTYLGDAGHVKLTAPFNPLVYGGAMLYHADAAGNVTAEKYPGVNHYVEQVEAFGCSIHDDTPYPVPLEFSQGTQGLIDRVFEVANEA